MLLQKVRLPNLSSIPPISSPAELAFYVGVYTLVSSANTTINTTPSPFANNNSSSTPQPGSNPSLGGSLPTDQPPSAPPVYSSKLAVVSVRLPVKEGDARGTGFGMSMGRRQGKEAEGGTGGGTTNGTTTNTTGNVQSGGEGGSEPIPIGGNSNGNGTNGSSGTPNLSPATKRRPLTSSFSMLGGLNTFTDSAASPLNSSRPSRALKGTTSSFIRSWEGLPLSQVQLKMIAEANAGKDTIFGFQTMGKGVFWNEIGKGKKVSLLPLYQISQLVLISDTLTGSIESNHLLGFPDLYRCESTHCIALANRSADRVRNGRHLVDG